MHLNRFGSPIYARRWAAFVEVTAPSVNAFISDAIVMWRAWVIWDKSRKVLAVSIALSLATVATGIWSTWGIAEVIASRGSGVSVLHRRFDADTHNILGTLVSFVLSLASNLWAFGLVAWKAWSRRRLVGQLHNEGFRGSIVGRTLVLLLESGAVYSLIWVLASAVISVSFTSAHTEQRMAVFNDVINKVLAYAPAVYPIAIVLIVAFQSKTRGENPSPENAPGTAVAGPHVTKSLAEVLEELPTWDSHTVLPRKRKCQRRGL
ncbi:hypothetical protein BC834DRAFT_699963 [Gloeopeniophorella convolvens]|nr:hypothetical protein BC834DRAFT_699963 [Gloeopeniophorella convolvens]